jgi:hemolysin III
MEKLAFREEVANSISHGLGLVLAIIAVPILVLAAVRGGQCPLYRRRERVWRHDNLLYLASTLYHSITHEVAKNFCRLFDHTAIFLLIAGLTRRSVSVCCVGHGAGRCWR